MNYLNFKNHYPKSTNKFFCWVAKQDPNKQNEYVDNAYFYQFFSDIFDYRPDFGISIEEKKYIDVLKPLLIKTRHIDNDYWDNESKILFGKYRDTGKDFIQIRFNEESDYENAFYVLETLINKGLYA
jgi:predicted DNA-binding protein (UPF0278 family)